MGVVDIDENDLIVAVERREEADIELGVGAIPWIGTAVDISSQSSVLVGDAGVSDSN